MIGGSEIFLVLLAVLLLFGANKLPEIAKGLGKGLRDIKKATDEIKDEITKDPTINDIVRDVNDLKSNVYNNIVDVDIRKTIVSEIEKPIDLPSNKIQPNLNTSKNEEEEYYR